MILHCCVRDLQCALELRVRTWLKKTPFSSFNFLLEWRMINFQNLKKKLIEQGASKELYAVPNFHMKSRKAYAWFYTNTVLFLYCIVFDAQWCNNTLLQTMLQMSCTHVYMVPYYLPIYVYVQGRLGAKTRGGSTPDFESDKNESPTKILWLPFFLLLFMPVCQSFCLSTCLFAFLPALRLVLFSHFLSFPPFPFFFLGDLQSDAIYSPTPGGSTRPPWPPFPDAPGWAVSDCQKILDLKGWQMIFKRRLDYWMILGMDESRLILTLGDG